MLTQKEQQQFEAFYVAAKLAVVNSDCFTKDHESAWRVVQLFVNIALALPINMQITNLTKLAVFPMRVSNWQCCCRHRSEKSNPYVCYVGGEFCSTKNV